MVVVVMVVEHITSLGGYCQCPHSLSLKVSSRFRMLVSICDPAESLHPPKLYAGLGVQDPQPARNSFYQACGFTLNELRSPQIF